QEVPRPLAVLFIVRRVEAAVVEVRERQADLVKVERQRVARLRYRQDAVRRVLELANVLVQFVRRLRPIDLSAAGAGARGHARFCGASTQTAAVSDDSRPAGASSNRRA